MKIKCSTCSARYSVADDRVAGRVLKVRCKKCGDSIVVRGEEAVWHSSIDGVQLGPLTVGELGTHLGGNSRAFVWREGLEDWVEARDVEGLAHLFENEDDEANRAHEADLFAPRETEIFSSSDDEPAAPTQAAHLTGSRNESSVLFSLSNLSALSGEPQPLGRPTPTASGDGSGLIDIRALATAIATRPEPPVQIVEDLLSFGGNDLASPLGAPVVMPERERVRGKLPIVIGTGFAAAVAVAAAAVVAVVQLGQPASHARDDERAIVREGESPALEEPIAPGAVTRPPGEPGNQSVVTDPEQAAEPETVAAPAATRPRPNPRPTRVEAHPVTPLLTRPVTPATREEDPLADIFEPARPRPAPRPELNLPETPSRQDIISAMNAVSPAVQACADGAHGAAIANVSFGSDGRVRSVDVTGTLAGPVRSCVARSVRTAHVPEFSRPTFRVNYPFRL